MTSNYIINTPLSVKSGMQVSGYCSFENPISFDNGIIIGQSGSIFYNYTGINFNSNLVPSEPNLTLGTLKLPWQSIYVSTGTVFIGPTGSILINSNGLVSSTEGFAAPYFQVGDINPGAGILLYEQNNLLYFTDQFGSTGPVSVFNITPDTTNDVYYSLGGNVGFGVTGPQQKIDVLGSIKCTDTVYSSTVSAANFTGTNLRIYSIESSSGSTLNLATVDNLTNTVNIGTANSIQTVNIGTVGSGITTINLGGVGDTVNVAGTLVYVNSTITEISNPRFILNQSGTNINNCGITVYQNGGPTGAYILVNSTSDAWTLKAGSGNLITLNQDVSSGSNVTFGTVSATNFTGSSVNSNTVTSNTVNSNTVTSNKINFDGLGSIYFQTGGSTGCFINGILNSTGSCNLYYTPSTKSITYSKPNYLYAYYTGTQTLSSTSFTGVLFNQVPILDGFSHATNSSYFSFTADTNGIYQISYSLQVHSNSNTSDSLTSYIEIDGTPILGSARSIELNNSTTNEVTLTHLVLASISSGTHTIQILGRSTNITHISLGNSTNIIPPGESGSAASITIHRII